MEYQRKTSRLSIQVQYKQMTQQIHTASYTGKQSSCILFQASVHNQTAYDAEVAARKRRNWLQNLYVWVTDHLRGEERWRAWETITAATEAGSRAATPKVSTRLLDELDRRRRGEATRRGGSAA